MSPGSSQVEEASPAQLVRTGAILVLLLGMLGWLWSEIGPAHPAFPLCVAMGTFGAVAFVGRPLAAAVPESAFRLGCRAVPVVRRLGVGRFDRMLSLIGWNAVVGSMRAPVLSPSDLLQLRLELRSSAVAHALGLSVHLGFSLMALFAGHAGAAAWLLLPGVLLHGYPAALQLVNLQRVEPVLERRRTVSPP